MRRWTVALALLLVPILLSAQVPAAEREALVALYNNTNGDSWTQRSGWLDAAGTECTWKGVVCDVARNTITALRLEGNRLKGTLPPEVGQLTNVTELTLGYNDLTGALPHEIGRLASLRILDLTYNSLTGPLPAELGNLKALTYIDFEFSHLEGPLPESLLGMSNLEHLDIRFNKFEGRIPDLTRLPKLTWMGIGSDNQLECGHVLSNIGRLPNLTFLNLGRCNLSGAIPFDQLLRLPLTHVGFDFNGFEGTIPREFAQIATLQELDLTANAYDTIPDEILTMKSLQRLAIPFNRFAGPVPSFARLTNLTNLSITGNQFTGPFPADLPLSLQLIFVDWNHLSGPLPDVSRFPGLGAFAASGNDFTGTIPSSFGASRSLFFLFLDSNRLTGQIPADLGKNSFFFFLNVSNNALTGEIPSELLKAPILFFYLENNMLRASDPAVRSFADALDPGWLETQTLPPASLAVGGTSAFAATVTWDRLLNTGGPGGVQIGVSTTSGGPYVPLAMTSSKAATGVLVSGLKPQTSYFAVAKAVTFANALQANTLFSDPSAEVTFTTKEAVVSPAEIAAVTTPEILTQEPGQAGGTTTYRIANIGGSPANVTLTQSGDFFVQSPSSFTLAPGASQIVALTGTARPENVFTGESIADGGAAGKVSVPVRLLSARSSSSAGPKLTLSDRRIDLVTAPSSTASGSFAATNSGDELFVGVMSADVEWILAPASLLRIAPGQTETVTFIVDPKKRPDPNLLTGTVTGALSLVSVYRPFTTLARRDGGGTAAATVSINLTTVVDPAESSFPPLPAGQVAYFLPGVGHVQGRVGLFLSDLSLLNASGTKPIGDLKLYYTAIGGSPVPLLALVSPVPVGESVFVGNVVKNVFRGEGQLGTLQIRSSLWDQLGISANVLNVSSAAGTYGTSIPVFRSDRAAAPDESVWLTGLRKDATGYTNLFIQETNGSAGTVTIDIFDEKAKLASRNVPVGPFETKQMNDFLPAGGVMARITGTAGSMRFHAFATPVDASSGDNWSMTDWSRQYGYDPFEPVVVPIAGGAAGAAGTNFRTDVAITSTNGPCPPQTARRCGRNDVALTYYTSAGGTVERTVTLEPLETKRLDDIVARTFNASGTIGWISVAPANGSLAVTSRTYNLVVDSGSTFGSAVATIAASRALRPGQAQRFAGITDDPSSAVSAKRPATYRNNIGVVEVLGEPAQVRITLAYLDNRGAKISASLIAQKELLLPAHGILLVPLTSSIIGAGRDELGTLRNVRVDVEVIGATGGVLTFISSVDNGTGDSIIRTD